MKILIVEDHPLIVNAYKIAFQEINTIQFIIEVATNCDEAREILTTSDAFDLVLLDMRLPPSQDKTFLSGEDIGVYIRKNYPNCKIMVSTTLNNNYRIHSILKSLNPDCLLIKNDITSSNLVESIQATISSPPYYSITVLKHLRKKVSVNIILDEIDRKLLYELSRGAKMKDLPNILPLSIAGIERRKRILKQVLNVKNDSDLELFEQARVKGFI